MDDSSPLLSPPRLPYEQTTLRLHPCSNLLHQLDHFFISPAPTLFHRRRTLERSSVRPALQTRPGRIVCSDGGASYVVCQSGSGCVKNRGVCRLCVRVFLITSRVDTRTRHAAGVSSDLLAKDLRAL